MQLDLPGSAEITGQLYVKCTCCGGKDTTIDLNAIELGELPYELADAGWKNGTCPDCQIPVERDPSDLRKEYLEAIS